MTESRGTTSPQWTLTDFIVAAERLKAVCRRVPDNTYEMTQAEYDHLCSIVPPQPHPATGLGSTFLGLTIVIKEPKQ